MKVARFRKAGSLVLLVIMMVIQSHAEQQQNPPQDRWETLREAMVQDQIAARGIQDATVLAAMRKVPRHLYVPENVRARAYGDHPLPIGEQQTISQPYIVAFMTEQLRLKGGERVLEIGTGSGYQAAILGEICSEVYTIEIVESLANQSRELLQSQGYTNVHVKHGDGYQGWPEHAPFDAIMVTAAPDHVPQPLVDQLKVGGRMILPVGALFQNLRVLVKTEEGVVQQDVLPVRFVPMTGEAQERRR